MNYILLMFFSKSLKQKSFSLHKWDGHGGRILHVSDNNSRDREPRKEYLDKNENN